MQNEGMTTKQFCDALVEVINKMDPESTGEWVWSTTIEHTDAEHLENYRHTLEKTRATFDSPEKTVLWFLTNTDNNILAMCGNSPTAEARAEYLAYVSPHNIKVLIQRLRELENGR